MREQTLLTCILIKTSLLYDLCALALLYGKHKHNIILEKEVIFNYSSFNTCYFFYGMQREKY